MNQCSCEAEHKGSVVCKGTRVQSKVCAWNHIVDMWEIPASLELYGCTEGIPDKSSIKSTFGSVEIELHVWVVDARQTNESDDFIFFPINKQITRLKRNEQ
jgi:hypothetical protein